MPEAEQPKQRPSPWTVTSAKIVRLALVHYVDHEGMEHTQLAVIGDNNVLLGSGHEFGLSGARRDPAGNATNWLRDGILKLLEGAQDKPKTAPSEETTKEI